MYFYLLMSMLKKSREVKGENEIRLNLSFDAWNILDMEMSRTYDEGDA